MPVDKGAAAPSPVPGPGDKVAAYSYPTKRKNNPPAGLAAQGTVCETPRLRYEYNPHLPPVLRFGPASTDALPELLATARQRALSDAEAKVLVDALRRHEPWLEWSGKRERPWFEVEPVALHIHERISTQAILRVLAREDVQRDLFADPQQEYAKAVQFYQHDVDWANRMILGDSLQVMASLARREDLAGKVQMFYIDPPYGISFKSSFQPSLGQRDVKDREQDLTREPEMVKAYRDTWTLGIHSYLAYLRDRLAMAKELLADTGGIFVQISDENLHRVRCVMHEVFGADNFVALITFAKTTGATVNYLPATSDYLLWYARKLEKLRFRNVFVRKIVGGEGASNYNRIEFADGFRHYFTDADETAGAKVYSLDNLTSQSVGRDKGEGAACWFPVPMNGTDYRPGLHGRWKTNEEGMRRLNLAERLEATQNRVGYVRYFDDFPVFPLGNNWVNVGASFMADKLYVVQTTPKVIERCLLMTTDPGDLVLDPTCGSGTTAYVAEQWGRRWITCDTSRVALALARQRLMTVRFAFYQLRPLNAEDLQRNPRGTWLADTAGRHPGKCTFQCKTVPHITLKSIARNTSLDPIFAKHEPILAARLAALNQALAESATTELRQKLAYKLAEKQKREGKKAITDADRRRWVLPGLPARVPASQPQAGPPLAEAGSLPLASARRTLPPEGGTLTPTSDFPGWREWEVPFDTDPDWPQALQEALLAYRQAWRAKMDEVNDCIAKSAEMEELVDKPEIVNRVVRVAGPFTMEGVIAVEDGPDTPIGGAPDGDLETFPNESETANSEAHLDKVLRLLRASGVDFPGGKVMKLARLEPVTGASLVHAEGEWASADQTERRVAVSVGPAVGNLSAYQVEEVVRAANRKSYDDVVFAGFGFDAEAQDAIEQNSHPHLRLHMALIRPDVAMGDLLKTQPGSQIFTVFSAPRVTKPEKQKDGLYVLEVEGMDVYDPVSNTLFPTDKERIAAWFLDSDYDGRAFCICQAFFPDKTKWQKLAKALGEKGVIDESRFAALSGLRALPFPRPARLRPGEPWQVGVKVIDPRGNEGLRVVTMP